MRIETIWLDRKKNRRMAINMFVDEVNERLEEMQGEGKNVTHVQYVNNNGGRPFCVVSYG